MSIRHLEPSFDNFWSLYKFTTSKRSGGQGLFYLTAKPYCRYLDKVKSNAGLWKDKFFFLRPPPGQQLSFPYNWRTSKPEPRTKGWGLDDDVINSLTCHWNHAKKCTLPTLSVGSSRPSIKGGDRVLPSKGKGIESEHPDSPITSARPSLRALVIASEDAEKTSEVRGVPKGKKVTEPEGKSKSLKEPKARRSLRDQATQEAQEG
ncbi:UNVERIFIED_CONTAM: hypothetical protein Sangu_1452000, partial [Sesamum angustifolium]